MAAKKPKFNINAIFILIFIITLGAVVFIVQYQTNGIITGLTLDRVKMANISLINYLSEYEERLVMRSGVISSDESIISYIKSGDHVLLKRFLINYSQGMDFSSICDEKGIVLARSYNEIRGDDLSRYKAVSKVIQTGKSATSIESIEMSKSPLSIYASAPIFDGGKLIGMVNICYDLSKSEYIDDFKEQTGCEATIFLGNERISTTLTDETGARLTGIKAFDFITETVIKNKKEYLGHLRLNGIMYGVCYSPLILDDEIIGMLFTGVDIESTLTNQRLMSTLIIFAGIVGLLAVTAFFIVSRRIRRKFNDLAEKQLNQQILMANISRSFLTDTDPNSLISKTMQMVGEFMNISQLLYFKLDDDGLTLICSNEWIDPKLNIPSRIGTKMPLKDPMLSIIKSIKPGSGKSSCLTSDDPVVNKAMRPYRLNFKNYITTPVFVKNEMIGAIDFGFEGVDYKWSDSEISLVNLFASTLSGVFEREAMGRRTSIIENSPIMIFYSDNEGKCAYANPAASFVTGYSLSELHEGGFGLILDEENFYYVKNRNIPQTIKEGIAKHEVRITCKDKTIRLLEVTSFILKDGMIAAICIDLTEKRALEAELIKAKEKAEFASRAKGEFLSNMSHEMRTPMNAIIGMTAIAKKAAEEERRLYALGKVEESSTHLLGIINDILDMSKIEANKLELSEVQFELRGLLQKAVSFVRLRMEEKKLNFSMNADDNIPLFYIGDDQRLTQVLVNLLSNAAKFTPEGGNISVGVFLVEKGERSCNLRFEVADSGIGISPEQQQKIFHVFEQAESGTTRKYGGTGLGLAISKRIVELMGGDIIIQSELGKGSTFIFNVILKMNVEHSQLYKNTESHDNADKNKPGEFSGKKLLIAEDIEINREIIISLLDGSGLIIDIAENGKEALDKASVKGAYDIIFMDMQMPEMDGLEATRQIRVLDGKIPIIAMTANVFKEDIENCLAAGMNDHIGKPIDIDTVFDKLRKYI
ncbi:MAG: ATP-binding protein [Treponema sp.]|nr:ATP-binding protein [Treponema sp.]